MTVDARGLTVYLQNNSQRNRIALPKEPATVVLYRRDDGKWGVVCNTQALASELMGYPHSQFITEPRRIPMYAKKHHVVLDMAEVDIRGIIEILEGMEFIINYTDTANTPA